MTGRQRIKLLLNGNEPDRVIYSPNIWQWFYHHKSNHTLPKQLRECQTLLDAHIVLGEDCFSRNLASDQLTQWYGGFTNTRYEGIEVESINDGLATKIIYHTNKGDLQEDFFYDKKESTLTQTKFVLNDPETQLSAFKELVSAKNLVFDKDKWHRFENKIGDLGMNIFGDLCNPLKLFHFACNPANTTYLLVDMPSQVHDIMEIHTSKCLDTAKQAIDCGVKAMMTMDNLDVLFFSPPYFKSYCTPFFKKLLKLCHQHDVVLMSHACGRIKELLPLCVQAGLDGLEGITPPPLGNVELYDAKTITGGNFICNGGITPLIQKQVKSKQEVYDFTRTIFDKFEDKRQFVFSMSCNTVINTSYDVIRWFGDATRDLSDDIFNK